MDKQIKTIYRWINRHKLATNKDRNMLYEYRFNVLFECPITNEVYPMFAKYLVMVIK